MGRAVFVTWNPPTTTRSRTTRVFCSASSTSPCCTSANRRCTAGGGEKDIRVMRHNSSVVLAGVLAVQCRSRLPCPWPSRQIRPPSFCESSAVPAGGSSAVPARFARKISPARARVVRSPQQRRPPCALARVAGQALFSRAAPPVPSAPPESPATLCGVVRSCRQSWSRSSADSPAKFVQGARQAFFASARVDRPESPPVPTTVAKLLSPRQGRPPSPGQGRPPRSVASAKVVRSPRQSRPPSESPAKLFLRVPKSSEIRHPPSPPGNQISKR